MSIIHSQESKKQKAYEISSRSRLKPGREIFSFEGIQPLAKSGRILEDSIDNPDTDQPNVSHSNKWREFVIQITNKDIGMYLSIRHLL